jgi:hypothetical protein
MDFSGLTVAAPVVGTDSRLQLTITLEGNNVKQKA